jgi:hypothetical protein
MYMYLGEDAIVDENRAISQLGRCDPVTDRVVDYLDNETVADRRECILTGTCFLKYGKLL